MSNVKDVFIQARVPWNWNELLTDAELRLLSPLAFNPVYGLRVSHRDLNEEVPNDHGGRTAMYELHIHGIEAISWPALDLIEETFKRIGTVQVSEAVDLEA